MKINQITPNYNQQNQVSHKACIKLVNPLGTTLKIDPRLISGMETRIVPYGLYFNNSKDTRDWDSILNLIEVVKAVLANSTHFWVNAKESDVDEAIKKAVNLPNGDVVTVGEPLLPLICCRSNNLFAYYTYFVNSKNYAEINAENVEEIMKNYPNTVHVQKYNYGLPKCYEDSNKQAELLFSNRGNPSGGLYKPLINELINWGQEDK